jgi:hypothetical protein
VRGCTGPLSPSTPPTCTRKPYEYSIT